MSQCHKVTSKYYAASAGVMAFHAAAPPSAEINMTMGNPIRVSVQQGFDDPSIPQAEALMTQVWEQWPTSTPLTFIP